MRFESLENRIVFALSTGLDSQSNEVASASDESELNAQLATPTPRSTVDDFAYSSARLSQSALNGLRAESNTWGHSQDQFEFADNLYWHKGIKHQSLDVAPEGHLIARRQSGDRDLHTMWTAKHSESNCYTSGDLYLQQDYHYFISFDVRHPTSETAWLQDHDWAIVMQMWGPRETGESARNPPFAIYTETEGGQPQWVIKSYGDSRQITQAGDFEETKTVKVPYGTIGEWQTWDIEFVPNPFGDGQIRAWLNGDLVAEMTDVKNIYYSHWQGMPVGPLSPTFGLYGGLADNGGNDMEVHLDDVSIQCNGLYNRSITGAVSGASDPAGHTVIAENTTTGKAVSTLTGNAGIYAFNLDPGTYRMSAINKDTGLVEQLANTVNIQSASRIADIEFATDVTPIPDPDPPTPDPEPPAVDPPAPDPEPPVVDPPTPEPPDQPELAIISVEASDAQDPNLPENVLDGNLETRWSAKGDGQTITFDLGVEQKVNQVGIAWYNGDTRTSTFAIEVSADGQAWSEVFDGESQPSADVYNYAIAESNVQFVRIVGFGNTVNTWNSILEVDISGPEPIDVPEPSPDPTPDPDSPNVDWLNKLTGDIDGDGKAEILTRESDGTWYAYSPDEGTEVKWGHWSTATAWHDVSIGDFNGDGMDDLVGRSDAGEWWASVSRGDGVTTTRWDRWSSTITWDNVTVGDFNGDGLDDIAGRALSSNADTNQSWWVAESQGDAFGTSHWAKWSDISWTDVMFADFNGDGRTDVAARSEADGTWWVGESTGETFNSLYWGTWSASVTWTDVVAGDFDGDGRGDIAGRVSSEGSWWVGRSTGSRFATTHWGQWSTNVSWEHIDVADFDGDGRDDIIGQASGDGSWWVARSLGSKFQSESTGSTWSQDVEWMFVSYDDIDGDGDDDLIGVDENSLTRIDT